MYTRGVAGINFWVLSASKVSAMAIHEATDWA